MTHVIDAKELGKRYVTKQRLPGRWARSSTEIQALSQLTLQVSNETLAVIGPNGAGKSTLVKLLTGLLTPSSGEITVCGLDPWRERRSLSHLIGVVLGHRSRLWYHLTAMESLALLGRMYDLNAAQVKQRLAELVEMFDADAFISQQVSSLSLGQRMRCEVMAALIHSPRLLLLDEPTIGLDVVAKQNLREHLAEIAARGDATILLTSHDLTDIQHLAQRILILDGGRCVFDGSLIALTSAYVHERRIVAFVSGTYQPVDLPGVTGLEVTGGEVNLSVDTTLTPVHAVAEHLLRSNDVTDISITEPPLEETIARIYKDGVLQ